MTSQALATQGTTIGISTGSGSPIAYTKLGEVVSYSAFEGSASEIDVTSLDSDAKEFRMGLQDFGQVQYQANYLPQDAGQVMARAGKASQAKLFFKITQVDGSYATFAGYVLSAPISGGVDAKVDTSFTVRVTGNVAFSS